MPDCRALVDDAIVERNALGYSGTNSGGRLVVKNSIFRKNAYGVAPNSLNNDDKPPPQNGSCGSRFNTSPVPTFSSTKVARCTIFRNNVVEGNNNLRAPRSSGSAAPWGVGFEWPGDYADLVRNNTIRNNVNFGILAFENPNPFPPTEDTIYFQVRRNKFAHNLLMNNGTRSGGADIGLEGGLFGSSSRSTTASPTTPSRRRSRRTSRAGGAVETRRRPTGGRSCWARSSPCSTSATPRRLAHSASPGPDDHARAVSWTPEQPALRLKARRPARLSGQRAE